MRERLDATLAWLDKNALWCISLIVMLASSPGDGRYIRSWYYDNWWGAALGYGINLAVDVVQEVLAYEFTRHQRDVVQGKARDRKRALSWLLFIGQLGLIYFAVLFAWRQFSLLDPDEPALMRWSMAAFAPAALVLLGVAQALREGQLEKRQATQREAKPPQPQPFTCEVCGFVGHNQQALNAHMRVHSREET